MSFWRARGRDPTVDQPSDAPTTMPMPAGATAAEVVAKIDPWIATAAVLLLAIGAVIVFSASSVRAMTESGSASAYLTRHLGSIALGALVCAICMRVPVETWSRLAYPLLLLSVCLLILVYIPGFGRRVNGALRWIQAGPLSFQPGELAKLAVIVYLAHSLAKKREKVSSFSIGFLPHVIVTSAIVALILVQPDLGTSAVIYGTLGVMMFVAGTRIGYLVLAVVAALPVGYHYVATRPHAWARLLVFLNPEQYKQDIGYQVWESIISFGSGGAFGIGLGQGAGKLHFLPESHTDFIFAVIGQELGFAGAGLVLVLFGVIVGRGLWIASKMPCRFPMFITFGIASWLGLQALVNMAVVVALLPTKGLTLPFVSYGRSSIVVAMVALGILLRASAELRTQSPAMFGTPSRRPDSTGTRRVHA